MLLAIAGIAAIIALTLLPADQSVATPTREGTCGCHPTGAETLLVVTGLPDTTYDPGTVYTITITVDDTNGVTGENAFSMDVVGGGTLSTTDPNVELNTGTQASANDGVSPMTVSSWTVEWTAPQTGSVTFTVYAVSSGADTGNDAPTDSDAIALNANEIPEFPALLLPLVGIVASVLIASRLTRKH